jgi:succinate-semialdehyde dehydrogenase / glutarate-semialdehyde dehydrogenase
MQHSTAANVAGHDPLLRSEAYIDGRWTAADDGRRFDVTNPATEAVLAQVPRMGAAETARAIEAAQRALPGWRERPARERAGILRRWSDLMTANAEGLALLLTDEQGKPVAESRAEIAYAASFLEWFGEEAKRAYGDVIPSQRPDTRIVVTKEPVGVCAGITPWNFPSAMVTRKAAPALAAGCTMVLKPAEQTPLSALALCALAEQAGLPPGVLNMVTGDASDAPIIGRELTSNPVVRKLAFTGSTEIGKLLMAQCAPTVKRVSLELGGNAPFIVFDDADLEAAVAGLITCKFRLSGQTCVSANRVLVQDGVFDRFSDLLVQAAGKLKLGNGRDQGVQQGPLIEPAAIDKVERHIADALDKGAKILLGGRRHALGGTWFEPTVMSGIDTTMLITHEETFGPVAGLMRFSGEDEAVEIANATPYGLCAYLYSRDQGRTWRVADRIECGIVGINTGFISTEIAPFGGMKESGFGREGSKYGIDEFLEVKYRCISGV